MQLLAHALLALSLCLVWWRPARKCGAVPWAAVAALSVGAALTLGVLNTTGALALLVLALTCQAARMTRGSWVLTTVAAVMCLSLALHAVPGFANPLLLDQVLVRPEAAPFSLHANFDKGFAGLMLVAFFSARWHSLADARQGLQTAGIAALVTSSVVLGLACAMGRIQWEGTWPEPPQAPHAAWWFLAVNLCFTCVTEEAFFRGLIQERLHRCLPATPAAQALCVVVSALLFGLAHIGGGWAHVALASLAGLGCAWAYQRTRTVEAPILAHFTLNALHFTGFTYPQLA
jgi:uncharacterized protein